MIDHQYDDRSNNRDHHTIYIEAGDPARAHRCKDEAPYDRPDNAEYDVEEEAFAGFIDDFAGDETIKTITAALAVPGAFKTIIGNQRNWPRKGSLF